MKAKLIILAVAIVFGLLSCGEKPAARLKKKKSPVNEMWGQETGYGTIYDNDTALARDRAIDDAMNKLVKKVLGTSISGRSIVENFQLVESAVEAKSTGMVRNWKIIKEGAEQGAYVVTLEGEVYPQAVNDTIEATLRNYGRPKFMVLVNETVEGRQNPPGSTVTELTMMDLMGKAGFEFVDAAVTQELMKKEKAKMVKAMTGAVGEDVQGVLLDDIGAEVIITGEVKTMDQSHAISAYSKSMKSKSAIANIKAVDMYTGRVLASTSVNQPGIHIDGETAAKMAIQRALQSALGRTDDTGKFISGPFMNQITKRFLESATHRMIMLSISGLSYDELTKFRNQIEHRVRGIQKVYTRGQAGKYSKIEVEFTGKTTDLADELRAKAQNLGFVVDIKETYPNRILLAATAEKK